MMPLPDPKDGPVAGAAFEEFCHTRDRCRAGPRIQRNRTITLSARELSGDFQPFAPRLQFTQCADIPQKGSHGIFGLERAQHLAQSTEPRLLFPRAFGKTSLSHCFNGMPGKGKCQCVITLIHSKQQKT